ncbi:MAG: hypothetical protein WAU17_07060, partial [Nitrospirales bacterium]
MNQNLTSENLGPPALKIAGFQLWVHGRQFPEAEDYDDGNWLRVTAHCGASGASVWAQGAILMVTDIAGFGDQCAAILRGTSNTAALDPLEPELKVSLQALDRLGHVQAKVKITPAHLVQSHQMEFEIDQSYLPDIIKQCLA